MNNQLSLYFKKTFSTFKTTNDFTWRTAMGKTFNKSIFTKLLKFLLSHFFIILFYLFIFMFFKAFLLQ